MPQTTSNVGRASVAFPDRGYDAQIDGGVALHAALTNTIKTLSDNISTRWYDNFSLTSTQTTTLTHNFNLALSSVKVLIMESGVLKTQSEITGRYTIAQVSLNAISIQNVSGGTISNIQVYVIGYPLGVKSADLDASIDAVVTRLRFSSGILLNEMAAPATPSSGQVAVYAKSDKKLYVKDSNGTESQVGSGAGGGSINYISNSDFENGLATGWTTYADAAASTPVDGTGGSANVTFTVSNTSPLRGTYSGIITKDAANRQGQGVSTDFTINSVDAGKTLSITLDISSTFASGDLTCYVYDVTNAVLITPSQPTLPTGTASLHTITFNATTSTSYRLIFHVASTSASAYTAKIDNISVSPVIRPQVAGISDWISYTPSISAGFGTASNVSARYKREGDNLRAMVSFTAGTVAASIGTITLPTGLTLDSSKLTFNNTDTNTGNVVGSWSDNRASANVLGLMVTAPATSTSVVYFAPQSVSGVSHITPASNTGTQVTSTGNIVACEFIVPIANWSSNITLSSTNGSIEYASNSSSTDADDTTSFVDGASGSAGIVGTTALTAPRKKRVSFKTPLQPTDRVQIEFIDTSISGAQWQPLGSGIIPTRGSSLPIQPPNQANGVLSGIGLIPVSSTQYDVWFGNTANTAAGVYGAAGSAWTTFTSFKWRVAKYSAIGGTELAPATVSSQGTVGYSQWTNAGLVAGDFTSFGTPTAIDVRYRREGDSLRMTGVFTLGTATGVVSSVNLPTINGSALTIDTTKIFNSAATTSGAGYLCGRYICSTALSPVPYGVMTLNAGTSTTKVYFGRIQTNTANDYLTPSPSGGNLGSSGDKVQFECLIPILGWS